MDDLRHDLAGFLREGLARATLDDPFLPSLLRWQARVEGLETAAASPLALALVHHWASRGVGDPDGPGRYPWEVPAARFLAPEVVAGWRPWDSEEKVRDVERWARGFWLPAVLGDTLEWLAELRAREAQPEVERVLHMVRRRVDADLAMRVAEHEPWPGTFALDVLAARPRTLERFHPILTALLVRNVTDAAEDGGTLLGRRIPLHRVRLVGATAQLGRGIVAIGQGLELLGGIVAFLRDAQRRDGGWGEEGQPTDLMTTLAAASFLASIDPDFDPRSPLPAIATSPEARRGWTAMDPRDASFVAARVAEYMDRASLPFAARFRWPHVPSWFLDPKCGLPRFGSFELLAGLFGSVPGLAGTTFEVAFLDLASFGEWNKQFGQAAGDEVLRLFGRVLREIPLSRAIQDGGDEMLVVGAPGRTDLVEALRAAFAGTAGTAGWPARFAERFPGAWPVATRGVVCGGPGAALTTMRDRGGRLIGQVKLAYPAPQPTGVLLGAEEAERLPG